ncbi:MAG: hypothetical protein ACK5LX_10730 [Oscillospiraceae bacterium]
MERLTVKTEQGYLIAEDGIVATNEGWSGAAADKLGGLEDLHEELKAKQEELSAELELLRKARKTKTVQFRELLSKKMMNSHALLQLDMALL